MSVIDGPNFSGSEDLIFYLDAANFKSYSGSGSTWNDLSSNRNHFTLFNTPTYTQNGTTGTYLTFNGTNQYARSTDAINFNAYSAVTIEIGYRSTVTNTSPILYETTGTGGSTATGGITLLMNANGTSTVANSYLSTWQGYGVRAFGYNVSTNSTFNSIIETFVNGVSTTGRQSYVNGTVAQFFTTTAVTVVTSATTSGLSFANTWTYVASRAGTGNFFRGDIAYIRAWGKKLETSEIATNSISAFARQPSSYQNFTILTGDPSVIPPALYQFTSATFTPGGATFRTGPTLTQARTGLTGSGVDAWKNNTSFFNVSATGIQLWTVPQTAIYSIDCYGAQGGTYSGAPVGGLGARIRGDFSLTEGQLLRLVVGQQGQNDAGNSWGGGGGGGTFVWIDGQNANPLIAAGGGGTGGIGGNATQAGGQTGTSGSAGQNNGGAGGTGGNASLSQGICAGGGGQGWFGGPSWQCGGSFTWVALFTDPTGHLSAQTATVGGFGGGGGSWGGGGGGGGYSGGGAPGWSLSGYGGGGGSFNAGTNQLATGATHSGSGQIVITKL
jgi:hypothetical protein